LHALVVHYHALPPQLRPDAAMTVTAVMLERDPLNRRPHFHLLLHWLTRPHAPVKPGAADPGQKTHPLHAQAALLRHHSPDVGVDALAPDSLMSWRRASICRKAPLKKSSSSVFSARTRFNLAFSRSSNASRDGGGGSFSPISGGPMRSRQL